MTVEKAIRTSGLLHSPHPEIGSWETSRAGAMSGEIVAFKNDEANFHRLSIRFFREGQSDENGYEYGSDSYIIETMDGEGEYLWEPTLFTDRRRCIEHVKTIMREVSDDRE